MQKREEERQGMRLIEIWVPDLNDPEIARELRRQSLLASQGEDEQEVLEFLENVGVWGVDG